MQSCANVIWTVQVVENRLFTGSTDGSLRIWTLKGLRPITAKQPANAEAADAEDVARQRTAAEQ